MSTRRFIAIPAIAGAVAATLGAVGGVGATAPSYASPEIGMQVLDLLCAEQDGTAYNTPYTISRCQEAKTRPGFEIETLVCEGLLGGRFSSTDSIYHPQRSTWICAPGTV